MNKLRNGMPEEVAAAIRKMGKGFSMKMVEETVTLYAGIPRLVDSGDITVIRDIAYGNDEQQLLDVHIKKQEPGPENSAVIMFVHGGGFTIGNKNRRRHIADYFAGCGYIGVNMTHRLAPGHKWPAGGQDIGAAVAWLHENITDYGGNPERIYLLGESSGAFHVATYVFRPDVLQQDYPEVAGAVMLSGPFLVDLQIATEGENAYFGDDRNVWSEAVFPGNLTRTKIPVLFTVAEYDPLKFDKAIAMMIYELTIKHGVVPRFRQLRGHNHISGSLSIGTGDMMLTDEIFDFITTTCRDPEIE